VTGKWYTIKNVSIRQFDGCTCLSTTKQSVLTIVPDLTSDVAQVIDPFNLFTFSPCVGTLKCFIFFYLVTIRFNVIPMSDTSLSSPTALGTKKCWHNPKCSSRMSTKLYT